MKRLFFLVVAGAVVVTGILFALRQARTSSSATVAALLPRETIAFMHLADFNRTRDQWYESDLYRLYREPAVQDFLRKPLSRMPRSTSVSETMHGIEQLGLKDGFVALTSMDKNVPNAIGGFRFGVTQAEAEKIIGPWRLRLMWTSPAAKRETVDYEQHKIEVRTEGSAVLATVYDGNWFFAASDLTELKALLDRVDGRTKDKQTTLSADEAFQEASGEMPADYALLLYLQPKSLADKLAGVRAALGDPASPEQRSIFEQIRSICATTRFKDGKMHDVIFIGMPKQETEAELTRSSLALAPKETFLYVTSLMNFSKQLALLYPAGPAGGTNFLGAGLQKIGRALAAAKISPEDWTAAFGSEFGTLAYWPDDAHWPSAIATSPVRDVTRAKKIVAALTYGIDEDGLWKETDRDGAHYWSLQSGPSFFIAIRPAIALSDRVLVAGLDEASVEATMRRNANPTFEFSKAGPYKTAAGSVPEPTNFFAYIDPALLYSRLDATLRPMLFMSAAFMPWINDYLDVNKLPAAEVVTKHLSPIVSSQRYNGRGYVAESVGPFTLDQSGIGVGLMATMGAIGYRHANAMGGNSSTFLPVRPGAATPPPASGGGTGQGSKIPAQSSPSPIPDETP